MEEIRSTADISEEEMAAALGAVYTYISSQEADSSSTAPPPSNPWLAAGRLESCGLVPRRHHHATTLEGNLWQHCAWVSLIFFLSASLTIAPGSCRSSTNAPIPGADPAQEMPPAAPPRVCAPEDSSEGIENTRNLPTDTPYPSPAPPYSRNANLVPTDNIYPSPAPSYRRNPSPASADNPYTNPLPAYTPDPSQNRESNDSCGVARAAQPTIRVGLSLGVKEFSLGTPDGAQVQDLQSGRVLTSIEPDSRYNVIARSNSIAFLGQIRSDGAIPFDDNDYKKIVFMPSALPPEFDQQLPHPKGNPIVLSYLISAPAADGLLAINGKLYRGVIELDLTANGTLNIVNAVDLEDYLLSVVPSEMPSSWPPEALRAQAIAARSYALANLGKHGSQGYDVKPTIDDQVYSGVISETLSSNQCVADTTGIVLKQQGKIIPAYFHSTSGGSTEYAEFVWGKSLPFLQSVPDYDDASPQFVWSKHYSVDDIEQNLKKSGKDVGQILNILVLSRTPSQHSRHLMVTGTQGSQILSSAELRQIFKLPSTNFNVGQDMDSYNFNGRGFGHALGLSQWGAKALAEHGYNAAQILTYYYKDVTLDYH